MGRGGDILNHHLALSKILACDVVLNMGLLLLVPFGNTFNSLLQSAMPAGASYNTRPYRDQWNAPEVASVAAPVGRRASVPMRYLQLLRKERGPVARVLFWCARV